jgi:ketosteroid isomerase-like protein
MGIGLLGISLLSGIVGESVRADDLADIQQAFEADIRLFNGQDPTTFTATAHDHVVLFGPLSPFAVEGKAAIQQLVQEYFTNHDYVRWRSVNAKFLVIETSGLAWGHYTVREQPRVGPRRILHGRYTFTYAKEEDQWLVVALDFSPL